MTSLAEIITQQIRFMAIMPRQRLFASDSLQINQSLYAITSSLVSLYDYLHLLEITDFTVNAFSPTFFWLWQK